MIVRCVLLILFLNCVKTIEDKPNFIQDGKDFFKYDNTYQFVAHTRDVPVNKREADGIIKKDSEPLKTSENVPEQSKKEDSIPVIGQSEGGSIKEEKVNVNMTTPETVPVSKDSNSKQANITNPVPVKLPVDTPKANVTNVPASTSKISDPKPMSQNTTTLKDPTVIDVNSPGVIKRALIVFGGLTLLAVAYFIFYRNKHKKFDANNSHGANESNQFRYGVLQSEDRRENLELSRIPLTMESDEDDDEDLEIFDLEQKRKSLSYVNLQATDEDIVLRSSKDESKNNLLLDIEDGSPDQLINWSSSGSKSIL